MTPKGKSLTAIESWYNSLRPQGGFAPRGAINVGLVVLERLKSDFNLDINAHKTSGGGQIAGLSGTAVKNILAQFGEHRRFASEGGRTNRAR